MSRFFIAVLLIGSIQAFSQNNFRSRQSGDWNQPASWEEFIAGSWQATSNTPSSSNGTINVRTGHILTITAAVVIDQTTVDVGGTIVVNDAITVTIADGASNDFTCNGTLIMLGEAIFSGAGNLVTSGTIRLGSLNATGALLTGTSGGNIRVTNRSYSSGANIIYEGIGAQFIGDGTPAVVGVNTIINNASGVTLNNTMSSLVSILGDLTLQIGNLTVQNNNLSVNSATATINLIGGSILMSSTTVARTLTARNVTHNGGDITITTGNATTSFVINGAITLNSGNLTLTSSAFTSTLTTNGAVNLNGGNIILNSGTENATLNFYGNVTGTSSIAFTGNNSNLNIYGNGALSRDFPFSVATTLENFIVDRPNSTVVIPSSVLVTRGVRIVNGNIDANASLSINANLDVNTGSTLFFEGQQLTIGGIYNNIGGYTGVLSASSSSTLNITGAGVFNTLSFSGSGNTIGTIFLNRATSGTLVTLNSPLTISTLLYLNDGVLNNISGLNLSSGATIQLNSNASLTGAIPSGGPYNLIYEGSSLSTQIEARGSLQDVTTNSAGTITVAAAMTVQGILNLNSGTFANPSGFLALSNGATLTRNGSATYSGTAPSGGPYNLIYNGATYSTGTEVSGALSNVTSNLSGTLTVASSLTATGILLVSSGTFSAGANAISAGSLQNMATFNSPSVNLTLTGSLTNDGVFNAGTGTIVFNGNSLLLGTAINSTSFNSIVINPAATLTSPATLNVLSNFTNDGSFIAGAGTVVFSGTVGTKVLSGATNTLFNNITLNKSNGGISLSVSSPQTVTNTLILTSGQLSNTSSNLALSNGATIVKNSAGTLLVSSPSGGPWNLTYVGGNQSTSLEIPATGALVTLTINSNNASTVTLTQALNVSGLFSILSSGRIFTSSANNISLGSFSNAGTFNAPTNAATIGLTLLGNFVNNGVFTHSSGTVAVDGVVTMSGSTIDATSFNNLIISGTGNLTPSAVLNVQGNFTNNGIFIAGSGNVNFSGTIGSKTLAGATNTQFFNVTLNKSNAGVSVSVTSPQTVTNSLTLTAGQLDIISNNLSLNNSSNLTRAAGSISTTSPGGGPWNLIYIGGSKSTSLEIPTTGAVASLTVSTNNATTITLTQNLNVSGTFSIPLSGRIFTSSTFNVTVGSLSNSGTFNAPTAAAPTGLTLTGNFVNNGTFAPSNGTVFIAGPVTMSGTNINTTNFNDIIINGGGVLTPSASLNIQGNFANSGSFIAGSNTVVFTGSVGSKTLSGTTNTQFNNLTLNKSNVGLSLTVTSAQTVKNTLTLTAGQISILASNLSLDNGATISRSSGSAISTTSPGGGPWNLIYIGASLSTSLEIPSGNLSSLTVNSNSGAIVTLTSTASIANALSVSLGTTFTSGAHTVNTNALNITGTFNAPSSSFNLVLTGNLTDNGTFNSSTGTTVFNGTSSVLGSVNPTFNHIIISGTLIRPTSLNLTGNFTNNGAFTGIGGAINFNGSSGVQSISGSTVADFNDLNINNTSSSPGVSVQSNQNLAGTLTLNTNTQFDADGSAGTAVFTLLSLDDSPTQDGRIAELPTGASVTGNVTAQRFMIAADDDDRFISSPVTTATVAQLQDDFAVTGGFTGTSYPCTGCDDNGASLFYYDETIPGAFVNGYRAAPPGGGSNTEILVPGRGYDAYMLNNVAPVIIDLTGPVNQGTINFTVSRTNSTPAVPSADGWNLVGNPYPSSIQWNNGAGWSRNLIDPVVYVWDRLTSAFKTYNHTTAVGNLPNGIIAAGQAFFVYAYPGAVSMSINESAKIAPNASSAYYRKRTDESISDVASLQLSLTKGIATDNSFIIFNEVATEDFDSGLDAMKLMIGREKLSIAPVDKDNRKLVHYALGRNYTNDIPLFVEGKETGDYSLGFSVNGNFDGYSELFLVDNYLGTSTLVSSIENHKFQMTENPATKTDRFVLSRNSSFDKILTKQEVKVFHYPNPVGTILHLEVNSSSVETGAIMDNTGKVLGLVQWINEGEISKGAVDLGNSPAGIYFARIVVDGEVIVKKILKN